eukprot:CAMPEP_0115361284 /NCGR_PEP_ID=MMETSP0270-20121206/102124_1 /TAXON_ID=71861 /ORGANISM="Scrippsiella trochoidea, Strain CCMP3099" /LENGTH=107 /DNA_ID=CAMNT_0002783847 /DNA_START=565 /DNA_END=889 /DNA_ORIENTATION=-
MSAATGSGELAGSAIGELGAVVGRGDVKDATLDEPGNLLNRLQERAIAAPCQGAPQERLGASLACTKRSRSILPSPLRLPQDPVQQMSDLIRDVQVLRVLNQHSSGS